MRGGVVNYTVTAHNNGPDTASNVVIADVIPAGLTFNAGASSANCIQQGGSILCDNFSLANNADRVLNIA